MKGKMSKNNLIVASLRLPADLHAAIMTKVSMEAEDLDFSKFVRRAIRHEFDNSKALSPVNQTRRQT
jgi:hypothetical protein